MFRHLKHGMRHTAKCRERTYQGNKQRLITLVERDVQEDTLPVGFLLISYGEAAIPKPHLRRRRRRETFAICVGYSERSFDFGCRRGADYMHKTIRPACPMPRFKGLAAHSGVRSQIFCFRDRSFS